MFRGGGGDGGGRVADGPRIRGTGPGPDMGGGAAGDDGNGGQDVSGRHAGHVHQVGGHRQRDGHAGGVERGHRKTGAQRRPLVGRPDDGRRRRYGRGRPVAAPAVGGRPVFGGQLSVRHVGRVADVEAYGRRHVPDGRDQRLVHGTAGPVHAVLGPGRRAVPRPDRRRLATGPPAAQAVDRRHRGGPPVRAVRARDHGPSRRRAVRAGLLQTRPGGRHADRPDGGGGVRARPRPAPAATVPAGTVASGRLLRTERGRPEESENRVRAAGRFRGHVRRGLAEEHGRGQVVGRVRARLRSGRARASRPQVVHGARVRRPAVGAVRAAGRASRGVRHRRPHGPGAPDRRGRRLDVPRRRRRGRVRGGRFGVPDRGTPARGRAVLRAGRADAAVGRRDRSPVGGEPARHGRDRRRPDGRGRDERRVRRPARDRPLRADVRGRTAVGVARPMGEGGAQELRLGGGGRPRVGRPVRDAGRGRPPATRLLGDGQRSPPLWSVVQRQTERNAVRRPQLFRAGRSTAAVGVRRRRFGLRRRCGV